MFGNNKTKQTQIATLLRISPPPLNQNLFNFTTFREQASLKLRSASLAIAFSWLSFHYENSKSTFGYPCKLKEILVDFLRAFSG